VAGESFGAGQLGGYGRYAEAPSALQLQRFFHFDERDRELIAERRGDHNRLGFAVQLATVRFLGTFLAHPADVPPVVARTVARELAIPDPECLALYARREQTHREHAGEIQRAYGYRDFEGTARAQLTAWLHARAWTTAERPSVLFDLATARLIEAKVLLPGASVLARLVAAARDQASDRLHAALADALTPAQREGLRGLLEVVPGEAVSGLERLRTGRASSRRPSCSTRSCDCATCATSASGRSQLTCRRAASAHWPATASSPRRRRYVA